MKTVEDFMLWIKRITTQIVVNYDDCYNTFYGNLKLLQLVGQFETKILLKAT